MMPAQPFAHRIRSLLVGHFNFAWRRQLSQDGARLATSVPPLAITP